METAVMAAQQAFRETYGDAAYQEAIRKRQTQNANSQAGGSQ